VNIDGDARDTERKRETRKEDKGSLMKRFQMTPVLRRSVKA